MGRALAPDGDGWDRRAPYRDSSPGLDLMISPSRNARRFSAGTVTASPPVAHSHDPRCNDDHPARSIHEPDQHRGAEARARGRPRRRKSERPRTLDSAHPGLALDPFASLRWNSPLLPSAALSDPSRKPGQAPLCVRRPEASPSPLAASRRGSRPGPEPRSRGDRSLSTPFNQSPRADVQRTGRGRTRGRHR